MGNSLTTAGVMPVMRVRRLRVAAAVLATAVLGGCDVRAPGVDEPGPARGVAAPVEGPGGVSAAHAWRLVGVAAGERTVILAVEHGSCERVDGPRAVESAAAVEVTVGIVRDVPEDHVCNDVLATTTLAADLEVPLGERTLTGCGRASCTTAQPEDSLYLGPQAVADVVGDTIVAAVEDGEVTAHEADTGVVRWTRDDADLDVRVAGAASATAPDGTLLALLLGGGSQTVALDLATGEERWRIVENPVTTPSVAGEVLVYAVEDGTVRAYDTATGAPRWEVRLPGDPPQAVVAEGDAVVVLHGQGQVLGPGDDPDAFTTVGAAEVTALDLATGAVRWRAATAGGPQQLVVAGDLVVVHVVGGLYGFELGGGAERWRQVPLHEDCWELQAGRQAITFRSGSGGKLRGVDLRTGARTDLAGPASGYGREATVGDLRVATDGLAVAAAGSDGGRRFRTPLRAIAGLAGGDADVVVVPTALGLTAIDAADGTVRWSRDRPLEALLTPTR